MLSYSTRIRPSQENPDFAHPLHPKKKLNVSKMGKAGANVIGIIKHLLNKALQEEKILLCGQYVTDRLRLKPEGLGLNPTVDTLYFALNCLEMK